MSIYVKTDPQKVSEFVQKIEELINKLSEKSELLQYGFAKDDVTLTQDDLNELGLDKYLVNVNEMTMEFECGHVHFTIHFRKAIVKSFDISFVSTRIPDVIRRFIESYENPTKREFDVNLRYDDLRYVILFMVTNFSPVLVEKNGEDYVFTIGEKIVTINREKLVLKKRD